MDTYFSNDAKLLIVGMRTFFDRISQVECDFNPVYYVYRNDPAHDKDVGEYFYRTHVSER